MINSVVIMGRLTADPELKTTNSGLSVTSFTVAVERPYKKDGKERETDFINVVAWRQTAEFVSRYFSKGSMIAVQGSIQTDKYKDKSGNSRTSFQVVADKASFCGSKKETGGSYTDNVKRQESMDNFGPNSDIVKEWAERTRDADKYESIFGVNVKRQESMDNFGPNSDDDGIPLARLIDGSDDDLPF